MRIPAREQGSTSGSRVSVAELMGLAQREEMLGIRLRDIRLGLEELREQATRATPAEKLRLDARIADLQRQETATAMEFDATHARSQTMEAALKVEQGPRATTIQQVRLPRVTRDEAEKAALGRFLLMVPLVIALARRIWVRGGQRIQSIDFDSSPRLARLEEAVDAIAIEIERVGEGQRFTAKLLAERLADPVARRITPPESPGAHRAPGVITPH